MSALRKEEPLSTADIVGRQRATAPWEDSTFDRADVDPSPNIDPTDRRPPRSAAGSTAGYNTEAEKTSGDSDVADIEGGEIVDSDVEPPQQSNASVREASQRVTYEPRSEAVSSAASETWASSSPAAASFAGKAAADRDESPSRAPLFAEDELHTFRTRWDQVQTSFVDEPRQSVEQADALVATVVQRIAEQFAQERAKLEQQWDRGDDVSTEELRQGLKRYRAFFDRLLSF
jgi:hypothetical protein